MASRIDARRFNPSFPAAFPRYLQKAIWSLLRQTGQDTCNGNQIDDRQRCTNAECPLFERCDRVPLRPGRSQGIA